MADKQDANMNYRDHFDTSEQAWVCGGCGAYMKEGYAHALDCERSDQKRSVEAPPSTDAKAGSDAREWPGITNDGTWCQGPTSAFEAILNARTAALKEGIDDIEATNNELVRMVSEYKQKRKAAEKLYEAEKLLRETAEKQVAALTSPEKAREIADEIYDKVADDSYEDDGFRNQWSERAAAIITEKLGGK